jgi:DGQHR domain-containing protein
MYSPPRQTRNQEFKKGAPDRGYPAKSLAAATEGGITMPVTKESTEQDNSTQDEDRVRVLDLSGYAPERELLVTRFSRGTRSVYTIELPLHLIPSHLPKPNPDQPFEGNRRINLPHARKFARYWRETEHWTTPPILLDTNADLDFKPMFEAAGVQTGILALPYNSAGILDILDGQHRVLGWYMAIEDIGAELKTARTGLADATRTEDEIGVAVYTDKVDRLERLEQRLHSEYITVELVAGVTLAEHKQAFVDITVNAKGITKSKTVDFDSSSIINRVARDVVTEVPILQGRVDFEQDRILGPNQAWLSARNVSDITRHLALGITGRMNDRREADYTDEMLFDLADEFFGSLVEAFKPLAKVAAGEMSPEELRKSSLLGSPTTIRVLAGVFHNLAVRVHDDKPSLDREGTEEAVRFFKSLAPHMVAPVPPKSVWHKTGYFPEAGGRAFTGRAQDLKGLTELFTEWAEGRKKMPF